MTRISTDERQKIITQRCKNFTMTSVEAKIRDCIASDVTFLSSDFKLLEVEYKLANAFGTRGYIDILAQDALNNFVIIEIKRSNQTARQAVQEILKYAGLLKQTLKVKESEIRISIVSTEWNELLVPFSEFSKISQYPLDGFKIYLNEHSKPVKWETIKPLETTASRELSPNHMAFLFQGPDKLPQAVKTLKERLINFGITDFVLLHLFCAKPNDTVIYPFSIYLAIQRYNKDYLKKIINAHPVLSKDLECLEEDARDDKELVSLFEQHILGNLYTDFHFHDTLEAGYPDKFMSIIEAQGWKVAQIERVGFFAKDPRLHKDDIIISELSSAKGGLYSQYHNFATSKFKLRLQEIEDQSLQCLWDEINNVWHEHVKFAFTQLKQRSTDYELAIDIFNPKDGILQILYQLHNHFKFRVDNPFLFLPIYTLQIHFSDDERNSTIYVGRIRWNGKKIAFQDLTADILKGDLFSYLVSGMVNAEPWLEILVRHALGFEYSSDVYFLKKGDLQNHQALMKVDDQLQYVEDNGSLYLEDFLLQAKDFLNDLTQAMGKIVHYR